MGNENSIDTNRGRSIVISNLAPEYLPFVTHVDYRGFSWMGEFTHRCPLAARQDNSHARRSKVDNVAGSVRCAQVQ